MNMADYLKKTGKRQIPMHMPGHKRRAFEHLSALDSFMDFTETPDSDDLHHPEGMLFKSQEKLAELYGADCSFYSVNGSTAGILSAIRGTTLPGDKVIVLRNCHKSVFNALEICGLDPIYILPPSTKEGFFGSIDVRELEKVFDRTDRARLVIITSPTYEGVLSDVAEIARICHKNNALLLVDEAHGAHLGFFDPGCFSAVSLGADVVVQSFHKTLPSLTQTAVVHLKGNLVNRERIAAQMALFQSSSPSYLLLASLDGCVNYMVEQGKQFDGWFSAVSKARVRLSSMKHLRLYCGEGVFGYDQSKICILTDQAGMTGYDLYQMLYEKGIVCELAGYNLLLAMTGAGDDEESLNSLVDALLEIDGNAKGGTLLPLPAIKTMPPSKMTIAKCFGKVTAKIPLEKSAGSVCGQMIYLYPPGIPMILPGECITEELLELLMFYKRQGVSVWGIEKGISVVVEE